VRLWAPVTDVRERRNRCRCVNMQFIPHALPFDDT